MLEVVLIDFKVFNGFGLRIERLCVKMAGYCSENSGIECSLEGSAWSKKRPRAETHSWSA